MYLQYLQIVLLFAPCPQYVYGSVVAPSPSSYNIMKDGQIPPPPPPPLKSSSSSVDESSLSTKTVNNNVGDVNYENESKKFPTNNNQTPTFNFPPPPPPPKKKNKMATDIPPPPPPPDAATTTIKRSEEKDKEEVKKTENVSSQSQTLSYSSPSYNINERPTSTTYYYRNQERSKNNNNYDSENKQSGNSHHQSFSQQSLRQPIQSQSVSSRRTDTTEKMTYHTSSSFQSQPRQNNQQYTTSNNIPNTHMQYHHQQGPKPIRHQQPYQHPLPKQSTRPPPPSTSTRNLGSIWNRLQSVAVNAASDVIQESKQDVFSLVQKAKTSLNTSRSLLPTSIIGNRKQNPMTKNPNMHDVQQQQQQQQQQSRSNNSMYNNSNVYPPQSQRNGPPIRTQSNNPSNINQNDYKDPFSSFLKDIKSEISIGNDDDLGEDDDTDVSEEYDSDIEVLEDEVLYSDDEEEEQHNVVKENTNQGSSFNNNIMKTQPMNNLQQYSSPGAQPQHHQQQQQQTIHNNPQQSYYRPSSGSSPLYNKSPQESNPFATSTVNNNNSNNQSNLSPSPSPSSLDSNTQTQHTPDPFLQASASFRSSYSSKPKLSRSSSSSYSFYDEKSKSFPKRLMKKISSAGMSVAEPILSIVPTSTKLISKVIPGMNRDSGRAYLSMKSSAMSTGGWDDDDDDYTFISREKGKNNNASTARDKKRLFLFGMIGKSGGNQNMNVVTNPMNGRSSASSSTIIPSSVTSLLEASSSKTHNINRKNEFNQLKYKASQVGRRQAFLDAASLGFFLMFLQQCNQDKTWSLYSLTSFVLSLCTSSIIFTPQIKRLSKTRAISTWDNAKYSQVWLNLFMGNTGGGGGGSSNNTFRTSPHIPYIFSQNAIIQINRIITAQRLRSFISLVSFYSLVWISLSFSWVKNVGSAFLQSSQTLSHLYTQFGLPTISSFLDSENSISTTVFESIQWKEFLSEMKMQVWLPLFGVIKSSIWDNGLKTLFLLENESKHILCKLSVVIALWAISLLPSLEMWMWNRQQRTTNNNKPTPYNTNEKNNKGKTASSPNDSMLLAPSSSLDSNAISFLGKSSCSRVQMFSFTNQFLQSILEKWKYTQPSPIEAPPPLLSPLRPSMSKILTEQNIGGYLTFRTFFYHAVSLGFSSIPFVLLHSFTNSFSSNNNNNILKIPSILLDLIPSSSSSTLSNALSQHLSVPFLQLLALFIHSNYLLRVTMKHTMSLHKSNTDTKPFLSDLGRTAAGVSMRENKQIQMNQRRNSISSIGLSSSTVSSNNLTKGISVNDLWVAHTSKRAWSTQGVSFQCRAGEIVLILGNTSTGGSSGCGKTRLLVSLSELVHTPLLAEVSSSQKTAKSTMLVRGSVSVCGTVLANTQSQSQQQDQYLDPNRVGILIQDVSNLSDLAKILSGSNLEEILEPFQSTAMDLVGTSGGAAAIKLNKKRAIHTALHMTGLTSSLLPCLPSRLSTVVATKEEELSTSSLNSSGQRMPGTLKFASHLLSPSEWNKVFLTKVLAQSIFHNDNPLSQEQQQSSQSPNPIIKNSLLGSVLLLDDPCSQMEEIEEINFLKNLKVSGAATVMTSNRWALGRYASWIIVLGEGGKVMECGTHMQLLNSGSVYASKWDSFSYQ